MRQKGQFIKDEDGAIRPDRKPRGWANNYERAVTDYLNVWDELFEKAQEKDEFQFILALLRFKGAQSAGWDNFENTIDAFSNTMKISSHARGNGKLNLFLWLYGHIVEASDHYEIIANMVNVAGGRPYQAWNFPHKPRSTRRDPKAMREQTPNEKILAIRARCKKLGLRDYTQPFIEVLDKDLRNAVYHSDYSVYMGKVRFVSGKTGFPVEYDADTTNRTINQALALHETIKNLVDVYRRSYMKPKIIDTGLHFRRGSYPLRAQVIVRKSYGVVALKEVTDHPAAFMVGNFQLGEKEKIEQGIFFLPRSKNDALNKIIDFLPAFLGRMIMKAYWRIHKNHYRG